MAVPLVQLVRAPADAATASSTASEPRKPSWLTVRKPGGPNYAHLRQLMRELGLHTVCEEARCPNLGECWDHKAATFMILGDVCTRNCAYCAVSHGTPKAFDPAEPVRLAEAVERMGLRHVVITSVDRDDLEDGGAVSVIDERGAGIAGSIKCGIESALEASLRPFIRRTGILIKPA